MDLRKRKTRRALREAFLGMRRELPLERVSVRELCERAEVSKATFYLHYHSVYDLSAELQAGVVRQILEELGPAGRLLESPREFTYELLEALVSHAGEVDALFSLGQEHALVESVERELRARVLEAAPEYAGDHRFNALLAYQVHGSYAAYIRFARGGDEKGREAVLGAIVDAAEAVASLW